MRAFLISLLAFGAGCREGAPPPVSVAPAPPPLVVGTSDAGTIARADAGALTDAGLPRARVPAALIHLVEADEHRVLLGPFLWPPKGTSVFVGQLSAAFVWKTDVAEDREPTPTDRTPIRTVVKDVDGDGAPELVVFLAPMARPLEPFEDKSTTWIFGVRPDGRVARMSALEYQVIGANDERTFDAELASVGKLGPTTGVPVERIVARLPWATTDEMRALVPAKGVLQCQRQAMKRSCSTVARGAIDAKTAKKLVETPGTFAMYASDDMRELQRPSCEEKGKRITCSASVGGPEGGQWVFERRGADVELVEIGSWAEDT